MGLAKRHSINMNLNNEDWPPYCCVPAFFDAALRKLGFQVPVREILAKKLGVTVAPHAPNPWGLAVARDEESSGVTALGAALAARAILAEIDEDLAFRHVSFKTIAFGLYADVAIKALTRDIEVGIGLGRTAPVSSGQIYERHVMHVVGVENDGICLRDDCTPSRASSSILSWDDLEPRVLSVSSGFWMVGRQQDMQFPGLTFA